MEKHGFQIYLAADNDLNPYGKLNDLKEIQRAPSIGAWPLAVQFHSPRDEEEEKGGIFSIAFRHGKEIAHITEKSGVNTGDPKYLLEFLRWDRDTLQCQRYSVVIWGHGSGPLDVEKQAEFISKAVAFDFSEDDALTTMELVSVLRCFLGDDRFSVLGFDACFMASVDVMVEMASLCEVYVASEAPVPEIGWPYELILTDLAKKEPAASAEIGQIICDQFLVLFSPQNPACISAVATAGLSEVVKSIRALVVSLLMNIGNSDIFLALFQALSAVTHFSDPVVDLFSLAQNLVKSCPTGSPINKAAARVCQNLDVCILANQAQGFNLARGISILFPPLPHKGTIAERYSQLTFCKQTKWHEFLAAYHRGLR